MMNPEELAALKEKQKTDPNVTALKENDAYPADPDNFYGWEKLSHTQYLT